MLTSQPFQKGTYLWEEMPWDFFGLRIACLRKETVNFNKRNTQMAASATHDVHTDVQLNLVQSSLVVMFMPQLLNALSSTT